MPTTTVTSLNVLAVYVTDLEKSESFYRDQLGFHRTDEMPPGILIKSGDVTLYLEANRQTEKSDSSKAAEFSPCFATESVKASYEALRTSGVNMVVEYREFAPTFAFFLIADPDGNLIEFAGKP